MKPWGPGERPDSSPVWNYRSSGAPQKTRGTRGSRNAFSSNLAEPSFMFRAPHTTAWRPITQSTGIPDHRIQLRAATPPLTTTSTLLTSPHIIQTSVQAAAMQRCCSSILPRLGAVAPAPFKAPMVRRSIHDIAITRTGKPIIRTPGGGRSACRTRLLPCPQIQMN